MSHIPMQMRPHPACAMPSPARALWSMSVPWRSLMAWAMGGSLERPVTLRKFVQGLSTVLPKAVGGIRVAGPADALVARVAVVGGAGDDFFDAVRASRADVYVTADLRHHPVLEAREEARGGTPYLVDAGHWATEWLWLQSARSELVRELGGGGTSLNTHICTLRTDPWDFVIGAATTDTTGGTS